MKRIAPFLALLSGCNVAADAGMAEHDSDLGIPIARSCSTPITPTVSNPQVSVTAPDQMLVRGNIHYVSGSSIDVALTIPTCTYVSSVTYGGATLGTTSGGIDAPDSWYEPISDTVVTGGHRVVVRIHFSNNGQGFTSDVDLTIHSTFGTPAIHYGFTVVGVRTAATTVPAYVSMSEAEIKNRFVASAYHSFGDAGRYTRPDGRVLYDYSYPDLQLTIGTDGISFGMKFKIDDPDWCDPDVHVWGRFHLERQSDFSWDVIWDDGDSATSPHVDLSFGVFSVCNLAYIIPVAYPLALSFAGDHIGGSVTSDIQDQVNALTGSMSSVTEITPLAHELRIRIALPDRIGIDMPYNTYQMASPWGHGTAVNPGDAVMVLGQNLVSVCNQAGTATPGTCAATLAGPNGLFDWYANVPVPYPYVVYDMQIYTYDERVHARAALRGLTRTSTQLPAPYDNVGELIDRFATTTTVGVVQKANGACQVAPTLGASPRITFGANDYRAANGSDYGSGLWRVTIAFPPACPVP